MNEKPFLRSTHVKSSYKINSILFFQAQMSTSQYDNYQCSDTIKILILIRQTSEFMHNDTSPELAIDQQPGYYIRRLHQISVAIFLQQTEAFGITPVQYAALQTVGNSPQIDQRTLARAIGLDTSTVAGVIDRLESRNLLVRGASPEDRRVKQLTLTNAARQLLGEAAPAMLRAQQLILEPLDAGEQEEFTRLLRRLVTKNNDLSRAPSAGGVASQTFLDEEKQNGP